MNIQNTSLSVLGLSLFQTLEIFLPHPGKRGHGLPTGLYFFTLFLRAISFPGCFWGSCIRTIFLRLPCSYLGFFSSDPLSEGPICITFILCLHRLFCWSFFLQTARLGA